MGKVFRKLVKAFVGSVCAAAVTLLLGLHLPAGVQAGEVEAKNLLKAMSDYMVAQKALSFDYDATLEVVTSDGQRLGLASSGSVILNRPDKIRALRSGGFADLEMSFDGKTLTLLGKKLNIYAIDHLIDELKNTYNRPLPAADLLLSNSYDEMMLDVVDVKDLGSGVIGGVECDHLAFRTKDVDWQIWIAQGDTPYFMRYVITSKLIDGGPQYSIQTRNWVAGSKVAATDFSFKNPTKAEKVELKNLKGTDDLPDHFMMGGTK
jgi:hypothetical protein